jgi:hypothetical protein
MIPDEKFSEQVGDRLRATVFRQGHFQASKKANRINFSGGRFLGNVLPKIPKRSVPG